MLTFIQTVEQAVKNAKWDRASYVYALHAMKPFNYWECSSIYKKIELIQIFYESILEDKFWNCIKHFTTFKGIDKAALEAAEKLNKKPLTTNRISK